MKIFYKFTYHVGRRNQHDFGVWVKNELIPFLKANNISEKILHYISALETEHFHLNEIYLYFEPSENHIEIAEVKNIIDAQFPTHASLGIRRMKSNRGEVLSS